MSSHFHLEGEIRDKTLFLKIVHKDGLLLYRVDDKGNVTDIVYFSSSRRLRYIGEVDQEIMNLLIANGFKVASLEFVEFGLRMSQE